MLETRSLPASRPAPAAQLQSYGRVALEARVAGASPHQLVAMLYQRLAQLLREAGAAAAAADAPRRLRATEKALAIVDGLDVTLDVARGGSVAEALRQVYALLRERLLTGTPQALDEAERSVTAIGAAWAEIGARVRPAA